MMKQLLEKLLAHETLSRQEAHKALELISQQEANSAQIASFITVYLMRQITVEELSGFREALHHLCIPVPLEGRKAIDMCGTGGDGKNTFNISTAASFVVAGAGYSVVKHGNYGVSSISGSSNIMECVGYAFTQDKTILKKQIDKAGICFMHAPFFHPALKSVGPVRKELGMKTFFNMLGPLVNPAFPSHQCNGVFSLRLARLYKYLLEKTNVEFTILHGTNGYDEITLTDEAKLYSRNSEKLVGPEYFGYENIAPEKILGGRTVSESVEVFLSILEGKGTIEQQQVVLANAALGIQCMEPQWDILTCRAVAEESLISGKALESLKMLLSTK